MAYDLNLSGTAEARAAAAKLARKHGCESHDGDGTLLLKLTATDDEAAKLFRALVKLARDAGATLHDPQAGVAVDLANAGRLPPGWAPSGPVPGATYKAKVKSFVGDYLRPHGFTARDPAAAVRQAERQVQGLHFVQGTGARAGHFTVDVYRTFDFVPLVHPHQMDASLRIERLVRADRPSWAPEHGWLPAAPARSLERSFALLQSLFADALRPLLDDTRTLEGLVAAFEAGRLTMAEAFGSGAENLARVYRQLGRVGDGRERYWAVLDALERSAVPYESAWARDERDRARPLFAG